MDTLLDLLTAEVSGTILVDNYTNHGLMIFDGKTLWFIAGLYLGTDGKAYCSRQIVSSLLILTTLYCFQILQSFCRKLAYRLFTRDNTFGKAKESGKFKT